MSWPGVEYLRNSRHLWRHNRSRLTASLASAWRNEDRNVWSSIYGSGSHFLTFSGRRSRLIPADTALRRAGVLNLGRDLALLSGLLSSSMEYASDVADSRCIQSHLFRFPTKSCGTLPRRRARANSCQPCGWKSFRCLTTSFTKSTMLLPLMTWPLWTNSPRSFQCMVGSRSMRFKRFSAFLFFFSFFFRIFKEKNFWNFFLKKKIFKKKLKKNFFYFFSKNFQKKISKIFSLKIWKKWEKKSKKIIFQIFFFFQKKICFFKFFFFFFFFFEIFFEI